MFFLDFSTGASEPAWIPLDHRHASRLHHVVPQGRRRHRGGTPTRQHVAGTFATGDIRARLPPLTLGGVRVVYCGSAPQIFFVGKYLLEHRKSNFYLKDPGVSRLKSLKYMYV